MLLAWRRSTGRDDYGFQSLPSFIQLLPRWPLTRARGTCVKFSAMGKLLDRAIEEAHKLPESEQEAVGAWLLAEIESERRWDELFSRPPSEALRRMAEEALEERRRGLRTGTCGVPAFPRGPSSSRTQLQKSSCH